MAALDWYIRASLRPRHLQLLVSLDEYRNLSKAAASLNITQSAASKTLAEMERGLGLKLFERTARGVSPTAYGECLLGHARTVLRELAQTREDLRALMLGVHGKIFVGSLPAAAATSLPAAVALLKKRSPETAVFIREGTSDVLLPELRSGKLDLIVGTLPDLGLSRELDEKILFEERTALVAGRDHPLASRRKLKWQDLAGLPWVLPPIGSLLRQPLEDALQHHGVPMPKDYIETLSVNMMSAYLGSTRAVGCLAYQAAQAYRKAGSLAILPLEIPRLVRPFGITWNRDRALTPSAQLLMQCMEEMAR